MTSSPASYDGGCGCGAVTYRIEGIVEPVLHCHCENCRRLSGNFVAATRVPVESLAITDPEGRLSWHDLDYARYGFCRDCGSTLFYQAADRSHLISVMVGTLDVSPDLPLGGVWFAAEAQSHHVLPEGVPIHDGNG